MNAARSCGPPRALVVDDSELALQFLERTLRGMGLHTERAARAEEALERLASEAFDIVLVDIDLGESSAIDGLALCRRIKRGGAVPRGLPVPVVAMVSVHAGEMDRVRGMLAGCDDFFGKPPDLVSLRRMLAAHGLVEAQHVPVPRRRTAGSV